MEEAAWVQAAATAVLVLVTIWYAIQTSAATRAASAAAKAAQRSAAAAEDAVKAASRPVIVVPQGRLTMNPANFPEAKFRLRNIGSGPALEVKVSVVTLAGGTVERGSSMSIQPMAAGESSPRRPGPSAVGPTDHEQIFQVDVNEPEGENLPWLAAFGEQRWGLVIRFADMFGRGFTATWRADTDEWRLQTDRPQDMG